MKSFVFAICLVSFGLANCANVQAGTPSTGEVEHLNHAQAKHLMREAHTPEQYRMLAGYFEQRKQNYLQQAEQEKQEWARRSQYPTGVGTKYPRPVDSAHYLTEYYESSAKEASALSSKYQQLIQTTETASNQPQKAVR